MTPNGQPLSPDTIIGVLVLRLRADGGTQMNVEGVFPHASLVNALAVAQARFVAQQLASTTTGPTRKVCMPDGSLPPAEG